MSQDPEAGETFLRVLIKAFLAFVPGGALFNDVATPLSKAGWDWLTARDEQEQREAIDALANLDTERARALAYEEARALSLEPQATEAVANYMAVVPMTTRNAVAHRHDGGRPKTLLSQLPRQSLEVSKFLPLRPPLFQPGMSVPGQDYVLEALVGQGGFGEVWRARHRYNHDRVAVKFCYVDESGEAKLEALLNEMRLVHGLQLQADSSPHSEYIVKLLATGIGNKPPFLIFEYMDGGDLVSWLAEFEGRPADPAKVARVLKMVGRALSAAHAKGVYHRDLKPANVLLSRTGAVKITDFGIGQLEAGGTNADTAARVATALHGARTPLYADPDGAEGAAYDLYSLGVIAYQLLVGDVTKSAGAGTRDALKAVGVDEGMIHIVSKCLTIPQRRYQNVGELLEDIDRFERAHLASPAVPPPDVRTEPEHTSEGTQLSPVREATARSAHSLEPVMPPSIDAPPFRSGLGRRYRNTATVFLGATVLAVLLWKVIDSDAESGGGSNGFTSSEGVTGVGGSDGITGGGTETPGAGNGKGDGAVVDGTGTDERLKINSTLAAALKDHGSSTQLAIDNWGSPTEEPDEWQLNGGKVVGQRFGSTRYVVAHSPARQFMSVIGQMSYDAERYIKAKGNTTPPNVKGFSNLVHRPSQFTFKECHKPEVETCD